MPIIIDLSSEPLSKLFWRYVIPTAASMLITGIYVTIDGIFVGHILGEDGLAAIMLAYPICAVFYAVGALIGMGSSSLASFYLGKGAQARARHNVGNALVMVLFFAVLLALIGINYANHMLTWMGAEEDIFAAGLSYLNWYIPCGLAGAAITTMLTQAVTGAICLWHPPPLRPSAASCVLVETLCCPTGC